MTAEWSWPGVIAVVTGGGGLLGAGMARAFAAQGSDIVVADLALDAAERTAASVREMGRRALAIACDVSDADQVIALADRAYAEFGHVDLLCNNAGVALLKPYVELTLEDWKRVLGTNLNGVIHGIHVFLPRMLAQGGARRHIVNTSSMSGVGLGALRPLNAPYVTTKFAIVGLSETLAPVLAEHGIGLSVLCPGMTVADPAQTLDFPMASAAWYKDEILGADDVARAVVAAVDDNRFYIFSHQLGLGEIEARHEALVAGFTTGDPPPLIRKTL